MAIKKEGYVIVQKGDTLWAIARDYMDVSTNTQIQVAVLTLKEKNNLVDENLIYVGQKIYLSTQQKSPTNVSNRAKIVHFGLQAKSTSGFDDRTVFATWSWGKGTQTEHYQVKWEYDTGDGVWFIGTETTTTSTQHVWSADTKAKTVRFTVKPISKKKTVNGKESVYWSASWSTVQKYSFADNPPSAPGKPTALIENMKLTAKVNPSGTGASIIEFRLWTDGAETKTKGKIDTKKVGVDGTVSYSFNVAAGHVYNIKCRSYNDNVYSDWSEASDEVGTPPPTPTGFTKCILQGANHREVLLEWSACKTADYYIIERAEDRSHFDKVNDLHQDTVRGRLTLIIPEEDTNTGKTYYFRLKAGNDKYGESGWSSIVEASTNTIPAAPTTWASSTSVMLGEPITLYWIHNSTDNNYETSANIEIYQEINGEDVRIDTITQSKSTSETERVKTSNYKVPLTARYVVEFENDIYTATEDELDSKTEGTLVENVKTNTGREVYSYVDENEETVYYCINDKYRDGTVLKFRVQTMGGEVTQTNESGGSSSTETVTTSYSQWSITRAIYIYAPPTMTASIQNVSGVEIKDDPDFGVPVITALPIKIKSVPDTFPNQAPISFHIAVAAATSYETWDTLGNPKTIIAGESIYSRYIEVLENHSEYVLEESISAGDIILDNNIPYTITITMGMNSGLSVSETIDVVVGWGDADEQYEPNAEIIIDRDDYSASIRPYCENLEGFPVEGVTLAVYRREYNGKFVEIASGLSNSESIAVTDPHPALDFARYRIVATYETTGAVTYVDLDGVEIGCKAAVIQWNEDWKPINVNEYSESGVLAEQPWAGNMLVIPYNIDINDRTNLDVEVVEYVGREHPVAYHGTHLGETSQWSMVIPKSDTETLYALRRLSTYMGSVYVREPSGTGYWAVVSLSYPLKHRDVTIPISMAVTRVEGGI